MKVVTDIQLDEIYRYIDTTALFVGRWQFRRTKASEKAYQEILHQKAWPAFEEWKRRCKDEKILEPKVVYGCFRASEIASSLSLLAMTVPSHQFIPLQLVTVGNKVAEKCQWLFAAHKYTDYLYLHGLAVETTEALAEYCHRMILRELGGRCLSPLSRISPGYPVWPNLADQIKICELLDAKRIGVTVSETYQLVPEYSTSAMIVVP